MSAVVEIGGETLIRAFGLHPTAVLGVPDNQPRSERERDFQDPLRREIAKLQVPVEIGYEIRTVYDNPRSERIDGMKRGYEFSLIFTLQKHIADSRERRHDLRSKTKTFKEPFLAVPYKTSIDHQSALENALETTQNRVLERVAQLRKTFGYLQDEQGNSQIRPSSIHPQIRP